MSKMIRTVGRGVCVAAVVAGTIGFFRMSSDAQPMLRARVSPTVVQPVTAAPVHHVVQAPVQEVVPATSAPLRVRRLVVARSIEGREPRGAATRFTRNAGRLYAFVELENRASPAAVRVRFEPGADARRSVGLASLSVPTASRWRTWAYSDFVRTPGEWSAVVEGADGRELARATFTVE